MQTLHTTADVLRVSDLAIDSIRGLLARFQLELVLLAHDAVIAGSYWGEPEAGLVGNRIHVRPDTPLHSLLHEACHAICMTADRRASLHTDAGGDDLEESAVCYLQIELARCLPGVSRQRLMLLFKGNCWLRFPAVQIPHWRSKQTGQSAQPCWKNLVFPVGSVSAFPKG